VRNFNRRIVFMTVYICLLFARYVPNVANRNRLYNYDIRIINIEDRPTTDRPRFLENFLAGGCRIQFLFGVWS